MSNGKAVIRGRGRGSRPDASCLAMDGGFEVISATTADEAINILEARSDIRRVFTDVNMPGSMDGLRPTGSLDQPVRVRCRQSKRKPIRQVRSDGPSCIAGNPTTVGEAIE